MKIGDLARATGVNPRLLRYYEEQGLLTVHRLPSGHRRYAPDAPDTVRRIRILLDAGLPTRTIRDVLPCVRGEDPVAYDACVATLLSDRLHDLDRRISELQWTRASLAVLLAAAEGAAA